MDMNRLNDARRVARLAFVLDELRKGAVEGNDVMAKMSQPEFAMCGGVGMKDTYSFYRQLVYAKRDSVAFCQRGYAPSAQATSKANTIFMFHDSDVEDIEDDGSMAQNEGFLMSRIAVVLRTVRKALRKQQNIADIQLDRYDFVRCGGHRTVLKIKKDKKYSLYRQLVLAKRDMQKIVERKRFPRVFKERLETHAQISDGEEEEDVDGLDGYVSGQDFPPLSDEENDDDGEDEGEEIEGDGEEEEVEEAESAAKSSPKKRMDI